MCPLCVNIFCGAMRKVSSSSCLKSYPRWKEIGPDIFGLKSNFPNQGIIECLGVLEAKSHDHQHFLKNSSTLYNPIGITREYLEHHVVPNIGATTMK